MAHIGVAIGMIAISVLVLICSLSSLFRIRYFNRTIYAHLRSGYDCAVGMWGTRFNRRHYVLVAIDSTNCLVALKHYYTGTAHPQFHSLTRWSGMSLHVLLQEAMMNLDKPVYYAVVRAIQLLAKTGNNRNMLNIKSVFTDFALPKSKKTDELSELNGYIVAPHVASVLAANFCKKTFRS